MVKYFKRYLVAVLAILGLMGGAGVWAANYNDVQFTADTTINLSGLGINITVLDGAKVASFVVGTETITVTLVGDANGYSNITFDSASKYEMNSDDGAKAVCGGSGSTLTFTVGDIKTKTVIISPLASALTCSGSSNNSAGTAGIVGGSGGGGSSSYQTSQQPATSSTQTSAPSIESLRAQIAQLLTQVAALQAQLGGGAGASQAVAFIKDLLSGTKNNSEVKRLQGFLISKGYLGAGLNTGNFLGMTSSAVKAYQKSKGIRQTGNAGPLTRAAINADLGIQ
jgi:hypothetical protein